MAAAFDQFVAFGTDIVGIERFLRLVQSLCLVFASYPGLLSILHTPLVWSAALGPTSLLQLQSRLNLTRRTIRLFWFLPRFRSSWHLYLLPEKTVETWLDVLAQSTFAMFALLESLTLLDLAAVGHLALFGFHEAVRLDNEAQVLWFVALYASALSSTAKLLRLTAPWSRLERHFRAVDDRAKEAPEKSSLTEGASIKVQTRASRNTGRNPSRVRSRTRNTSPTSEPKIQKTPDPVEEANTKSAGRLTRKLLAQLSDLILPASRLGLIKPDVGFIGTAMLFSTVLTSLEVWDKCSRQLQARPA